MAQVVPLLLLSASVMSLLVAIASSSKDGDFRRAGPVVVLFRHVRSPRATRRAGRIRTNWINELSARAATGAAWRQTRLIVRLNGKPLPLELVPYRRAHLDLIDAYVLEMPDSALNLVARHPDVADAHFDRADLGNRLSVDAKHRRRCRLAIAGLHRQERRRGGDRFRDHRLARRPHEQDRREQPSARQPARQRVRRFRQRADRSRTTTTVTARMSPASFSATDTTLTASSRAWRPTRTSSR